MKKRIITEADYLAELAAVAAERPPEGAFSALEVAASSGRPVKTIEARFKADVRAGVLETGIFLHNSRLTRFYWLAK
jgi:hypothetical protein